MTNLRWLSCLFFVALFHLGVTFSIHKLEDKRTRDEMKNTVYFGAVEKVTPVLYRISQNSSGRPIPISSRYSHALPQNVDLVLRRKHGLLRMRLHQMHDVIGSHTRVEWTEGEVTESKVLSSSCVYHGKVDELENSYATVDFCNDMRGVIRTSDEDIYLQPNTPYVYTHGDIYTDADRGAKSEDIGTHTIVIHRRPKVSVRLFQQPFTAIDLNDDTSPTDEGNQRTHTAAEEEQPKDHRRQKRQTLHRGPRFMQVLLVTDGSLVRFHGRNLIEQYLLTQMSIVDSIYHHPSLGFEVNIIVVKIKVIEDSVMRHLVIKGDGKSSLDRFCQWASNEKPKNKNKDEDFDVAVYITKKKKVPTATLR